MFQVSGFAVHIIKLFVSRGTKGVKRKAKINEIGYYKLQIPQQRNVPRETNAKIKSKY